MLLYNIVQKINESFWTRDMEGNFRVNGYPIDMHGYGCGNETQECLKALNDLGLNSDTEPNQKIELSMSAEKLLRIITEIYNQGYNDGEHDYIMENAE